MRKILVIGAGRSASSLIKYLLDKSTTENLFITIADLSLQLAQKKLIIIPIQEQLLLIFSMMNNEN